MIDIFRSIVLGIIQGLTEFIPISSSAHLVITRDILRWPDWGKSFDVALHLGTLLSLLVYFWKDILIYFNAFFQSIKDRNLASDEKRLVWVILASTVPAFAFGGLLDEFLKTWFDNVYFISSFLILFGILMWAADHFGKKERELKDCNFLDAVVIGLSQALALMPGVSRSGITMTAALARKFKRPDGAKFAFLMLIPVVSGAVIYKGLKFDLKGCLEQHLLLPYIAGALTSFIVGYIAVKFLLKYLEGNNFNLFVIYRLLLGFFLIAYFYFLVKII